MQNVIYKISSPNTPFVWIGYRIESTKLSEILQGFIQYYEDYLNFKHFCYLPVFKILQVGDCKIEEIEKCKPSCHEAKTRIRFLADSVNTVLYSESPESKRGNIDRA
jgi:hypothetical protein